MCMSRKLGQHKAIMHAATQPTFGSRPPQHEAEPLIVNKYNKSQSGRKVDGPLCYYAVTCLSSILEEQAADMLQEAVSKRVTAGLSAPGELELVKRCGNCIALAFCDSG